MLLYSAVDFTLNRQTFALKTHASSVETDGLYRMAQLVFDPHR
jgi:hypothetical protein